VIRIKIIVFYEQINFDGWESFAVKRLDKFDYIFFPFVLDFLLLHSQIIVILEVGIHNHLIQVTDYANMRICLHIIIWPFLQLAFFHIHLRLVHYLQV